MFPELFEELRPEEAPAEPAEELLDAVELREDEDLEAPEDDLLEDVDLLEAVDFLELDEEDKLFELEEAGLFAVLPEEDLPESEDDFVEAVPDLAEADGEADAEASVLTSFPSLTV